MDVYIDVDEILNELLTNDDIIQQCKDIFLSIPFETSFKQFS